MKKKLWAAMFLLTSWAASAQSAWTPLGAGLNTSISINDLALDTSGNVFAAGNIFNSSAESYVAKWDGTSWSEPGSGANALHANGGFGALATDLANNVYAAGSFTNSFGLYYVARWDGTSWSELGAGGNELNADGLITALATDNSGNVYAGGQFRDGSGHAYVAKWDGNTWTALGSFGNGIIYTICTDIYGNVYAAGSMHVGTLSYYVAKWNGSSWSQVGSNTLNNHIIISSICSDNEGNLYAGGLVGNVGDYYVAKFDGTSWAEVGPGSTLDWSNAISTICVDTARNVYVAGGIQNTNGKYYVAKWDHTSWSELGTGMDALNANGAIYSLVADKRGNIYATGAFTNNLGKPYVAKYTPPVPIDSVAVSYAGNAVINTPGGTLQVEGNVYPAQASQALVWSISPASVASISNTGLVTAIDDGTVWVKATSVRDTSKADSLQIVITNQHSVHVNEIISNTGVTFYPNPASKTLHVTVPSGTNESAVIRISTITGNVVKTEHVSGKEIEIAVDQLSEGLYFFDYTSGMQSARFKFIKK